MKIADNKTALYSLWTTNSHLVFKGGDKQNTSFKIWSPFQGFKSGGSFTRDLVDYYIAPY